MIEGQSDGDRVKMDRLARMLNVVAILQAHGGEGVSPKEIAKRTGVAKRTVYRDLEAIQTELRLPVWSENGRWGMEGTAFLPPLRFSLPEATAVFLSARLVTRFMDKHDPHLASAFTKLRDAMPPNLGIQVERSIQELTSRPLDADFNKNVADLTRAWAERRVVQFTYTPAAYNGVEPVARLARVRPYLLEPSLQTHAIYLIGWDEDRNGMRTFKVERISELSILPQTFDAPDEDVVRHLRLAWDIIADQKVTDVVLRFSDAVADRVLEATWHPSQKVTRATDGSLEWRARVAGTIEIRLWILSWGDEVEVLEPASLREDVAATHRRAAERYAAG